MPATIEERVAYLEGKVEEHSKAWVDLKEMIIHLDQKVDRHREELSGRINALDQKLDRRMDALDQRLSGRMDAIDQRLSGRMDALDQKFSKFLLWIIGVQVTTLLAMIAALLR
jgi:uncharacterized coiled-coil protein SlyX